MAAMNRRCQNCGRPLATLVCPPGHPPYYACARCLDPRVLPAGTAVLDDVPPSVALAALQDYATEEVAA